MTRTLDLRITNALLYQLSYAGTERGASICKTSGQHNTKHADFPFIFRQISHVAAGWFSLAGATAAIDHERVKTTWTRNDQRHGLRRPGGQRGFSLIEVAVAAAIFSLGLGSMSLLLVLAVHGTQAPRSETLAALYAQSLADASRLVPGGDFAAPAGPAECTPTLACSPAAMASTIMESWRGRVERDLPTGRGLVCRDSTPIESSCAAANAGTIRVTWRETDPESGDETTRAYAIVLPQP